MTESERIRKALSDAGWSALAARLDGHSVEDIREAYEEALGVPWRSDKGHPIEHVIIAFDTTSAAFASLTTSERADEWTMREIRPILSRLIRKVTDGSFDDGLPIIDTNGATVGVVTITRAK